MDKPIKPTNLMPRSFGGVKNNWSASMQASGYEDGVPAIYGGDNVNYQLDATGKELDYCEKFADFLNAIPIGKTITVDDNNKLVYADLVTDTSGKANVGLDNLSSDGKAKIAIKQYSVTETYALNDVVMTIVNDEVALYKSLVANNVGNAISDDTKWEKVEMGGGTSRNIGEIVQSTIPLVDAGLHLLDGALIDGSGIYSDFVDYIADLYSEEETTWEQPVLTSNGTVGGINYACEASSVQDNFYAYKAFDDDTTTRWGSLSSAVPDWLTFYSPYPLKVSEVYLDFYQTTERYISGEIQGSNDNTNWTTLTTFSNNSSQTLTLPISTNNKYKYIRFYGTSVTSDGWGKVAEFKITATYTQTPEFFTTEENWQNAVTNYGYCNKFVYNSVNNTVRLPKFPTKYVVDVNDSKVLTGNEFSVTGNPSLRIANVDGSSIGGALFLCHASGDNRVYHAQVDDNGYPKGGSNYIAPSNLYADIKNSTESIDVYYYIVIATSTKTEIQVDIDDVVSDLNNKVDRGDLAEVQCVVETYVNGTSWYRVYSDGWCEQGGYTQENVTVTFLKPFINTNYTINGTYENRNIYGANYESKTATSVIFRVGEDTTGGGYISWQASGYIL